MRKKLAWLACGLAASVFTAPVQALDESVGETGINARRLHESPYNLLGRKIAIGQVEIGRPGKFGLDKAFSENPLFAVAGVFEGDRPAKANVNVDAHAAMVAMVMIGQDKKFRGVAPEARLYSSAVGSLQKNGQPEECHASQYIAQRNGGRSAGN